MTMSDQVDSRELYVLVTLGYPFSQVQGIYESYEKAERFMDGNDEMEIQGPFCLNETPKGV